MAAYLLDNLEAALAVLRHRPSGLISDLDGTLVPIAPTPDRAAVPARTRELLQHLCRAVDLVAIASGRRASEVRDLLGIDCLVYVGNHGLEWQQDSHLTVLPEALAFLPVIRATADRLRARLRLSGVTIEEKGPSISVHYRLASDPLAAREHILRTAEELRDGLRITEGRMVVNLLPPVPADKGTAVRRLVADYRLAGAIYMGDDITDLDAFRVMRELRRGGVFRTLAVAVSNSEVPPHLFEQADYLLQGPDEVTRFLAAVVARLSPGP